MHELRRSCLAPPAGFFRAGGAGRDPPHNGSLRMDNEGVVQSISFGAGVQADDAGRLEHVRPAGWRNPVPQSLYDLVVLGGGTAGLVCAMGAAGLGARVALVERHLLGGDCLNTGCVPSKAMIRSARAAAAVEAASAFGVDCASPRVDFARVMARLRARRAAIAPHDSAARLEAAGVDVFFGRARFTDRRTVLVDAQRLRFSRAVIATGSRPAVPPIAGLDGVMFLTSETIWDLDMLPPRLVIVGAGAVGCELAQAFARFGSVVTVIDRATRPLMPDDPEAARLIQRALERDGVRFHLDATIAGVEQGAGGLRVRVHGDAGKDLPPRDITGDTLLVATGRTANTEDLDLTSAGVAVTAGGVVVNDRLQSSNPRIYASGDVCSAHKFTHAADALSRLVLQNALFFGRARASRLAIPWVTFTDPELAHVGVTHEAVAASGGRMATITVPLAEIDRAIVDDETDGFVRVHHERGRVIGCTIVSSRAGDLIGEAVYAVAHGGTLSRLSSTIHPYPTQAEALRRAGDRYRRQSVTPRIRRWLSRYFEWTRW